MARFLVVFQSHPMPPFDTTAIDVRAPNALQAVHDAKRDEGVSHPWHLAYALPWPRGCADANAAVKKIAELRAAG